MIERVFVMLFVYSANTPNLEWLLIAPPQYDDKIDNVWREVSCLVAYVIHALLH